MIWKRLLGGFTREELVAFYAKIRRSRRRYVPFGINGRTELVSRRDVLTYLKEATA